MKYLVIIHTKENGKKTLHLGGQAHQFKQLDIAKTGKVETFEVDAVDMHILSNFGSRFETNFCKIM